MLQWIRKQYRSWKLRRLVKRMFPPNPAALATSAQHFAAAKLFESVAERLNQPKEG